MGRILGLDFETTGLDIERDLIIEIGYVLWDTTSHRPLLVHNALVCDDNYPPISKEIEGITGIVQKDLKEFGKKPKDELELLLQVVSKYNPMYIVAHNGNLFDKPLLFKKLSQYKIDASTLKDKLWIDTRDDLPVKAEFDSKKLKHMAGEHGFLNPFAHRAIFDVLTMLKVLSFYDIEECAKLAQTPWKTIEAKVSFNDRDLAKARKFNWDPEKKVWFKKVRETNLQAELEACNFKTVIY